MSYCEFKTNNVVKTTCDSYAGAGMCGIPEMFRCPIWIEKHEPRLSHSGLTNFLRCPRMYYYSNIMGLQTRPEFQSDPLKIGIMVDDYITGELLGGDKVNMDIDSMYKAKAVGMIKAFNKLIDIEKVQELYTGQKEFLISEDGQPQIKGYIDMESKSGTRFIELKCGKSPSYYTQLFYIRSKLTAYFMSNKAYKTGIMWVIRVPQLKLLKAKSEDLQEYSARCTRAMVKEPGYYFPGYSRKSKFFGLRFGRVEFDLDVGQKVYRMVADWIKQSIAKDIWIQNGTGCLHPFECDYLPVCQNNGAISEDVFVSREKETRAVKLQS